MVRRINMLVATFVFLWNASAARGTNEKASQIPGPRYSNESSTSAIHDKYCLCTLVVFTDSFLWYDEILSVDGPTMIYTIDEETHATLGSSLRQSNTTSTIWAHEAETRLGIPWVGPAQQVTLNTQADPS
jgi:hypothetical protein